MRYRSVSGALGAGAAVPLLLAEHRHQQIDPRRRARFPKDVRHVELHVLDGAAERVSDRLVGFERMGEEMVEYSPFGFGQIGLWSPGSVRHALP